MLFLLFALYCSNHITPPMTSTTLNITIYDTYHDKHPTFSSKWAATSLAHELALANPVLYYQHEPTKKGSISYPFLFLGVFSNSNCFLQPLEHMYGHLYMCSADFFCFSLYFRFTQMLTKYANPIHTPTATTSSSKWAATSPAHKSAPVNHELTKKGNLCYPFLF